MPPAHHNPLPHVYHRRCLNLQHKRSRYDNCSSLFPFSHPPPPKRKAGVEETTKKNENKHGVNGGRESGDAMLSMGSVEPKTRATLSLAKDSILYFAGGEREKKSLARPLGMFRTCF